MARGRGPRGPHDCLWAGVGATAVLPIIRRARRPRTFGAEGGFRTEVTSRTKGQLSEEDRRQVSLLMAQVFEHIASGATRSTPTTPTQPRKEVNKAREAIKAIRTMLPRATVHTRTTTPDGKVIYEDEREVQESRIPLYEGMLHAQTLAPILAARRNAMEVAGVQVVESERIATEVIADIDTIEGQLTRAAKALEDNKPEDAAKALAMALVRGIELRFSKEDSALASARDAIWLARRSLEENNAAQALANLADGPAAAAGLPRDPAAGPASGGGPDAPRGRPTGGPTPPGGHPAGHRARAGPPGQHGDRLVGSDQQLVQAAFLMTTAVRPDATGIGPTVPGAFP